jgi:uncharacterized membrane protein (TIGR02234 family)
MRGRRTKSVLLAAAVLAAALVFASTTQTWVTVTMDGAPEPVLATAATAAPALSALALAQLALVGALALVGRIARVVLGVVQLLIGGVICYLGGGVLADPLGSSTTAIAKATAISGSQSIAELATDVQLSVWPTAALAGGIAVAVIAVLVLVTGRTWPGSSRKYDTATPGSPERQRTAVDDWDALTAGDDPTE